MRLGAGLFAVSSCLLFAGACGAPKDAISDGGPQVDEATSLDAPADAAGPADADPTDGGVTSPSFCRGAQALSTFRPDAAVPYVTLTDDAGQGCVFLLGEAQADPQTCGTAQPTGYTEACPFTAVDFDVWSDPKITTEFSVQGAYAWAAQAGYFQNGRVLEMVVDSATPMLTAGHFRVALDPPGNGFEAATVTGTFSLCTTPEVSVDPCRQPRPLPN